MNFDAGLPTELLLSGLAGLYGNRVSDSASEHGLWRKHIGNNQNNPLELKLEFEHGT